MVGRRNVRWQKNTGLWRIQLMRNGRGRAPSFGPWPTGINATLEVKTSILT